ncbi:MAG: phosphoethanolamine transferase [Candidatus Symbiothrix sp.]|jgi:glucan phosphoethanolaminetransferase (alkaline phosphatase superfamily)|nr:phosphoethanolamine transferase [Candidatus Symbiothrix sp.]
MLTKLVAILQKVWKYYLFVTLATLFIGVAFSSAEFVTIPTEHLKDALILFLQWSVLVVALWPVIQLISLNKYVFALLYPLLNLLSCILVYFRYTTGTTLTSGLVEVVLDNHSQTTLISGLLIAVCLLTLLISILFAVYRFTKIKIHKPLIHTLLALILFAVLFHIPQITKPISKRIPFNLYYATAQYLTEKREAQTERPVLSTHVTSSASDDLKVVLIIGETVRADHLGINGYSRNTTPHLAQEDVISFSDMYSPYTYTAGSLPFMLTRADHRNWNLAYTERSFTDVFKQAGFQTAWLANQESNKSFVYFMNECDTLIRVNVNKSSYTAEKWTDDALLPPYNKLIAKNGNELLILHTIGSHWYFNNHFTDEYQHFNPITRSRVIRANTSQEMINSYDNTILFTDYFWYEIINNLRKKNAIIFYLSDHGEALGENGVWLHATENEMSHYPACWIWMSPQYKTNHPNTYDTFQKNKNKAYTTAFLFHTILKAAGIESDVIDETQSLFH